MRFDDHNHSKGRFDDSCSHRRPYFLVHWSMAGRADALAIVGRKAMAEDPKMTEPHHTPEGWRDFRMDALTLLGCIRSTFSDIERKSRATHYRSRMSLKISTDLGIYQTDAMVRLIERMTE